MLIRRPSSVSDRTVETQGLAHPTMFGEPGRGQRLQVGLAVQVGRHDEAAARGGRGGEDHHVRSKLLVVLHLQDVANLGGTKKKIIISGFVLLFRICISISSQH